MSDENDTVDICVVLTVYKRNHIKDQLCLIRDQTVQPKYIVVFQNGNHVDIEPLKKHFNFIHVKSDFNTKFFGRFSYCLNIPADIFLIFDDDMFPAKKCIQTYVTQCIKLNAIIGGNGGYGHLNKYSPNNDLQSPNNYTLKPFCDAGFRDNILVDFVGHLWCFKKEWLYYMFSVPPLTYDTGEDMHLCFSSKLLGNIPAYIGKHTIKDEFSDVTNGYYSDDQFASFRKTPKEQRISIEQYWLDKGLKFIEKN